MADQTSEISIEDYMNFHPNVMFDWEGFGNHIFYR